MRAEHIQRREKTCVERSENSLESERHAESRVHNQIRELLERRHLQVLELRDVEDECVDTRESINKIALTLEKWSSP